ncbi:hypothetical protein [Paraburkholderia ginsengiterrae]|uniref:hypothetical protein n=1 Tax=Paraburkholderia ginsengiterrae TaxID=1462993 RepID=UPI00104251C7|nr:hypothetical protein [Paraburkholderia ginsengiterrae]
MKYLHMTARSQRDGLLYRLPKQMQTRLQKRSKNVPPNPPRNRLDRTIGRARVYPMPGRFLNPVALSNIETYPMACGWSGAAPRFLLLRSSSGTLVTMQAPMKIAQSMLARLKPAGTRARTSQ